MRTSRDFPFVSLLCIWQPPPLDLLYELPGFSIALLALGVPARTDIQRRPRSARHVACRSLRMKRICLTVVVGREILAGISRVTVV
jgi:hypothetical protein